MTKQKLRAEPIAWVRSLFTGEVQGVLYRWNTGETQTMWRDKRTSAVSYEPLGESDPAGAKEAAKVLAPLEPARQAD